MKKKCLLVCLLCCLLLGLALAEEPMTETVLFEGSQPASGGWNLALTIDTTNVNGTFDPSLISENGYFAVTGCKMASIWRCPTGKAACGRKSTCRPPARRRMECTRQYFRLSSAGWRMAAWISQRQTKSASARPHPPRRW